MITFASVDLPEPFGPIRAWTLPFSTSRSSPLRISLSSTFACRLRISSSANLTPVLGFWEVSGGLDDVGLAPPTGLLRELDQLRQRRPGQRLGDAALDPRPEELGRTGTVAVVLMRAEDFAFGH